MARICRKYADLFLLFYTVKGNDKTADLCSKKSAQKTGSKTAL